jgi:putative NADH-flavin reductase
MRGQFTTSVPIIAVLGGLDFVTISNFASSNLGEHLRTRSKASMKVVLYGASGNAGSRILRELQIRGHNVTAVVRNPEKLPAGVKSLRDDLSNVDRIAEIIHGADAVVSAYMPPQKDTDQLIPVTQHLIDAVRKGGNPRLIIVGGAASLEVAPGVTVLSSGHLPKEWVPIATSHAKALDLLKASDIRWTYFSPAGFFEPGARTGKFRLGKDQLVTDSKGESRISYEDYAIALVDELERPAHVQSRFTIGY